MRVLLADDDPSTRDVVVRALEGAGHDVVACDDGIAAEAVLADPGARFDVLVTDVEMPGLDGVELAERAVAAQPKVLVLFISGFDRELDRAHASQPGRSAKLLKPFSLQQLKDAVAALVA